MLELRPLGSMGPRRSSRRTGEPAWCRHGWAGAAGARLRRRARWRRGCSWTFHVEHALPPSKGCIANRGAPGRGAGASLACAVRARQVGEKRLASPASMSDREPARRHEPRRGCGGFLITPRPRGRVAAIAISTSRLGVRHRGRVAAGAGVVDLRHRVRRHVEVRRGGRSRCGRSVREVEAAVSGTHAAIAGGAAVPQRHSRRCVGESRRARPAACRHSFAARHLTWQLALGASCVGACPAPRARAACATFHVERTSVRASRKARRERCVAAVVSTVGHDVPRGTGVRRAG